MDTFFQKIKLVLTDRILRKRILFTLVALALFRLLAAVPIPGIDTVSLSRFLNQNQFFGLLNVFSGGGLSNLSLVMLGVGPYITASIIMQLLTMMSEKMKAMYQEEGDAGRRKFSQYARLLSVPLALLQAVGFMALLEKQGVLGSLSSFDFAINVLVVTGGSVLLMWIGELITEFGIGNGSSLIIFGGIVASLPTGVGREVFKVVSDPSKVPLYIIFLVVAIAIIYAVVYITEAERPVPVTYAKQVRGNRVYGGMSTYIPLRLNQAGVIPIIFALSILLFPQMILNFLKGTVTGETALSIIDTLLAFISNQLAYGIFYFFLVFLFTYFYTAVTFDPKQIADNLQKGGAFIPGVRPGQSTADFLGKIITRITLVGALFLGFIAVLPLIMKGLTGITSLAVGGTALLIVVSVIIDLVKKVEAQISMREY
jgi:preprotein translocase subunit SecY